MDKLQPNTKVIVDETGLLDVPFLVLTLMLVVIGVLTMFSASYARAYVETGNSAYYFARQGGFALAGIAVMFFVSRVNYQLWRTLSVYILAASVFFLILVPFFGFGDDVGARRWLGFGSFSFQPSETAKVAIVFTFAAMIASYREKMETLRYGVAPFAAILGVIAFLLVLQPHLSATIIILTTGAVLMFLGGTKIRWFVVGAIVAVGGFLIYLQVQGYASTRVSAWQDPFADAQNSGFQIVQSLYAIGSGGLMGLGMGKSRQKYLYLPEEHNDYIFAVWCEEMGFIGAVLLIVLFLLLIMRGYWISVHAKDRFGSLVAAGFSTLLLIQVFLNIGVVTNFLPSTGISLPFFSYGGTALLIQLFEMGVVLNISRHNQRNLL